MHIHTIQLNIEKVIGGTIGMDATEFGAYMSLVIAAYQCKNRLPDNDERLSRIARLDLRAWVDIKDLVMAKFSNIEGSWMHDGVQKELDRCFKLSEKNKANALKRNESRKPVGEPNLELETDASLTQKEANTNNKEQITNNNKKEIEAPLELFPSSKINNKKGTRLTEKWELPEEWGLWAVEQGLSNKDVLHQEEVFRDYWIGKAGKEGIKLDWSGTWRNWIRRHKKGFAA